MVGTVRAKLCPKNREARHRKVAGLFAFGPVQERVHDPSYIPGTATRNRAEPASLAAIAGAKRGVA